MCGRCIKGVPEYADDRLRIFYADVPKYADDYVPKYADDFAYTRGVSDKRFALYALSALKNK